MTFKWEYLRSLMQIIKFPKIVVRINLEAGVIYQSKFLSAGVTLKFWGVGDIYILGEL